MKKMLFATICLVTMIACSSESDGVIYNGNEDIKPEPRISFKSSEDVLNTYFGLSEMNFVDFNNWIQNNNPSFSLNKEYEDEYFANIPIPFQALFNNNLELNIQDTIVRYSEGSLYILSTNGDEEEAQRNSMHLSSCSILGSAGIVSVKSNSPNLKGWNGVSGLGYNYQVPFNYGDGRYQYKYVYEIETFKYRFDMKRICYDINVVNKMEYKYKKWDQAGESRTVDTNINGKVIGVGTNRWGASLREDFNINIKKTEQVQYKAYTLLARTIRAEEDSSSELASWLTSWEFDIQCNITQEVSGVPSTRKSSSFRW